MKIQGTGPERPHNSPQKHRAEIVDIGYRLRGFLLTAPSPIVVLSIADARSGHVVHRVSVGVATRDLAIALLRRCEEMQGLGVSSWRRGLPLQLWAASVLRGVRQAGDVDDA